MFFQSATVLGILQMCQMKKWSFTLEVERKCHYFYAKTEDCSDCFTLFIHFSSFDVKPICRVSWAFSYQY